MTVKAKFTCVSKEHETGSNEGKVVLQAVTGGGDSEDGKYFKYTPWGQVEMGILNEAAFAQFEPGQDYYVEFSPA